jgi:hypothetical protein
MKKIRLFILMFASLFAIIVQAQDQTISGTVVDESGEPVIGASVVKKGTTQGSAVTNLDGQFTVQAATGSTLVISYVGFLTQEVKATPNMTVKLHGDTKNLNEVVVIGYGTPEEECRNSCYCQSDG